GFESPAAHSVPASTKTFLFSNEPIHRSGTDCLFTDLLTLAEAKADPRSPCVSAVRPELADQGVHRPPRAGPAGVPRSAPSGGLVGCAQGPTGGPSATRRGGSAP